MAYILANLLFLLTSCGTGIEVQNHVSDKDVQKVETQYLTSSLASTIKVEQQSLSEWKPGKRFYVTDNQIRLIFEHSSAYDPDSIRLSNKYLLYQGLETENSLDNDKDLVLRFSDGTFEYRYDTHKSMDEIPKTFSVPFLIDMDMVDNVAKQLQGKSVWIRTRIWYNPVTAEMIDGRQFIQVRVDSVLPGDKVLPLKVLFTALDNNQHAMLRMATGANSMRSRDFDSMFSLTDLHKNYPDISPENWARIQHAQVIEGMNKDECRLAKGAPKSISRIPDQDGLREYWYYDGGSYLYFVDGILKGTNK